MSARTTRKRQVKKVIAIDQQAPSGLANYTMYTAVLDGETLSGLKGNVSIQVPYNTAAGSGHLQMAIIVARDGAGLGSLTGALTGREAESVIWHETVKLNSVANIIARDYNIEINSKAMRKLRAGDTLQFYVQPVGQVPEISFMISVFLKQP